MLLSVSLMLFGSCLADWTIEVTQWKCRGPWDNNVFCASNGLEYSDPWKFICDQRIRRQEKGDLYLINYGPCNREKCPVCSKTRNSVCGSDGVTYYNSDELTCMQILQPDLNQTEAGACGLSSTKASAKTEDPCKNLQPGDELLCASDGNTYLGNQRFECKKKDIPDLKKVHDGPCAIQGTSTDKNEALNCSACRNEGNLVCGSDGRTYNSYCHLNCTQATYPDLHLAYEGSCQVERCSCSEEERPICGTNGHTYKNKCHFDCNWKQGLYIAHYGECKDGDCLCPQTDTQNPVCGSDGVTYLGVCKFHCQQIKDTSLTVKNMGYCRYLPDANIMIRSKMAPNTVSEEVTVVTPTVNP